MSQKSISIVSKTNFDADMLLKQNATDESLTTTDKTIVGAINELKARLDTLSAKSETT